MQQCFFSQSIMLIHLRSSEVETIICVDWPMGNVKLKRSACHKNEVYKTFICGGKYAMWVKLAAPIEVFVLSK